MSMIFVRDAVFLYQDSLYGLSRRIVDVVGEPSEGSLYEYDTKIRVSTTGLTERAYLDLPAEIDVFCQRSDLLIDPVLTRVFEVMDSVQMALDGVMQGQIFGLFFLGSPGVGKSNLLRSKLRDRGAEFFPVFGGSISAVALYERLYEFSTPGQILLLEDAARQLLSDPDGLSVLKAATDDNTPRIVTWDKHTRGLEAPRQFPYAGSIIVTGNYAFSQLQKSSRSLAGELESLRTRGLVYDLDLTRDEIWRWIRFVVQEKDMLGRKLGLSRSEVATVMEYIERRFSDFSEPSLRTCVQAAKLFRIAGGDLRRWERACDNGLIDARSIGRVASEVPSEEEETVTAETSAQAL